MWPYNDLEQELIKVLDKKKIKYYSCIKELNIDNNKLYFLQTKEYDNENDNSNVIYSELNVYKFMFMGDAGIDKEKDILDKYNLSNVDVLKVGHHGSKTSSSKEFINVINPKYSIISVGKNNRYGHPNKEVLENLENSKIYVDLFPCNECAKEIIQVGIKELYYLEDKYKDTKEVIASKKMLDACGVKYTCLKDKIDV